MPKPCYLSLHVPYSIEQDRLKDACDQLLEMLCQCDNADIHRMGVINDALSLLNSRVIDIKGKATRVYNDMFADNGYGVKVFFRRHDPADPMTGQCVNYDHPQYRMYHYASSDRPVLELVVDIDDDFYWGDVHPKIGNAGKPAKIYLDPDNKVRTTIIRNCL